MSRHHLILAQMSLIAVLLHVWQAAVAQEFEFLFWPGPAATADPRFVAMYEGPCGEVAAARVHSMPKYSMEEQFAPERVFEINTRGDVLRRWRIPVDAMPHGIDGHDLLFSFSEKTYRVTPRGKINLESKPLHSKLPESVQCIIPEEFLSSDYARCWRFDDLRTQRHRVLIYEGACT